MLLEMLYSSIPAPEAIQRKKTLDPHCQHTSICPQTCTWGKNVGPRSVRWVLSSQEGRQDPPALGFRLLTPVQLPLAEHPWALQDFCQPHAMPRRSRVLRGGSLPPAAGVSASQAGTGERALKRLLGRSLETLQLPARCVSKTTPIAGPLSSNSVNIF